MTIEDTSGSSHGVEVSGTIYPKAPVGDLGLSGVRCNNIYGNYLHGNGASITSIPYSALTGTPSIPSIPSSLPAKSIFAHNFGDTTYGSNAYNSYQGANLIKLEWVYYKFAQIYLFLNNLNEAKYYAKKSLDLNSNFDKAKEIINIINWKKFIL